MRLPTGGDLDPILDLKWGAEIDGLLASSLLDPLEEFLSRPSKRFRGECVELAFRIAKGGFDETDRLLCERGAKLLEYLHAGSLVVDDIEDDSLMRRGTESLHRRYGMPLALNAGNWLYFWPLESVREWGLDPAREVRVYQICHRALLRAHFGQALDVGVAVDTLERSRVRDVSLASLELKSGALMALALSLGAALGGGDDATVSRLENFGRDFGVVLQMLDDMGNLTERAAREGKRYEDLRLRRPSWVWAVAADGFDDEDFERFRDAVRLLPDAETLENLLAKTDLVGLAKRKAWIHLDDVLAKEAGFREIGERLRGAYD